MNFHSNDTEEINTFAKKDEVARWYRLANYLYVYSTCNCFYVAVLRVAKRGTVKT